MLRAFYYVGAKGPLLQDMLLILENVPHSHYCEPFAGSAVVLLNKRPVEIETLNDLHGDVVNFFRVLRDRPEDLVRALHLTPYARQEYLRACEYEPDLDDIERARRFFVRACQSYGGLGATKPTPGRWAYAVTGRFSASGNAKYRRAVDKLSGVTRRLQHVQLECDDALTTIRRYDSTDTLFYVDPPYPSESRSDKNLYAVEMSNHEHMVLARLLQTVKAKVIVSSYDCELTRQLYPVDAGWHWYFTKSTANISSQRPQQTEVLIANFPGIQTLF